jgi:hypothetical protein
LEKVWKGVGKGSEKGLEKVWKRFGGRLNSLVISVCWNCEARANRELGAL